MEKTHLYSRSVSGDEVNSSCLKSCSFGSYFQRSGLVANGRNATCCKYESGNVRRGNATDRTGLWHP